MDISIRYAGYDDCAAILELLKQVRMYHQQLRPDIFRENTTKYSENELRTILEDENRPILIAADENNTAIGCALCIIDDHRDHSVIKSGRTLYVDDFCVDERFRVQGIGTALMNECLSLARDCGAKRLELTVWACNTGAMAFYENFGMKAQRHVLELKL